MWACLPAKVGSNPTGIGKDKVAEGLRLRTATPFFTGSNPVLVSILKQEIHLS